MCCLEPSHAQVDAMVRRRGLAALAGTRDKLVALMDLVEARRGGGRGEGIGEGGGREGGGGEGKAWEGSCDSIARRTESHALVP